MRQDSQTVLSICISVFDIDAETGTSILPRSTEDDTERHHLSSYSTDTVVLKFPRKIECASILLQIEMSIWLMLIEQC